MNHNLRYLSTLAFFAPLWASCGAGTSSSSAPEQLQAGLTVAITDAASEELSSFIVDVTRVTVTKLTGQTYSVLRRPKRVDLVTLESKSEILNAINVPAGVYKSAEISFDFSNAEAYLLQSTVPALLLDGDGAPLTGTVVLPIAIGTGGISMAAGRHRMLELDFDLDNSVIVDVPTNTVFVEPAIAMRIDRNETKLLTGAGELKSVNREENTFIAENRGSATLPYPTVEVGITAQTVYQIDGIPYTGGEGISRMTDLPLDTWVQGWGAVDLEHTRLNAHYVEAGRGTYGGGDDHISGNVIGRIRASNDRTILTVLGHSEDANHGNKQYNQTYTITTSLASTKVLIRSSSKSLSVDRINVGQHVRVYGSMSGNNMDAENGIIRLQPTSVFGIANGPPQNGMLEVTVVRVGRRLSSNYTWNESGPTPPDPQAFVSQVAASTSRLNLTAGSAVELRGYFTATGSTRFDFAAQSVDDLDQSAPLILVHNRLGGQSVQAWATPSSIQLNVSGTPIPGELAHVFVPLRGSNPLPRIPSPTFEPYGPSGQGIFTLRDRTTGFVSAFSDFATFADAYALLLSQGARTYNFGAAGPYDDLLNRVSALRIMVTVE